MASMATSIAQEEADLMILPPLASSRSSDLRNPRELREQITAYVSQLSKRQKIFGLSIGTVVGFAFLLFIIFHKRFFAWLGPLCESWSEMRGGAFLLFLLISVTAFPPIIGYTTLVTLSGIIFGFWYGWFIAALATVIASYVCFVVCRIYFIEFAERLAENNQSFEALSFTLHSDGLRLLWMIRMSPLPFSFSNAALSTIPTISTQSFFVATALSTPKLFIHVFIGSRLRSLGDESLDFAGQLVNYLSIGIGALFGATTGWLIYQKMSERARILQQRAFEQQELHDEPLRAPSAVRNFNLNSFDEPRLSGRTTTSNYRDEASVRDSEDDEEEDNDFGRNFVRTEQDGKKSSAHDHDHDHENENDKSSTKSLIDVTTDSGANNTTVAESTNRLTESHNNLID
ncbi:hypothetical protein V1514DRAFT_275386 [Lipomyces japonicus]|uniref:uncharacterized protein n=1 Tax=Lipomyces japonicus TaxID=56871 RepID=UPI0034CFE7CC